MILSALTPPSKQTTSEWADRERKLSPESSAEPGQWRTARVPYLRAFMDAFDDATVREILGVFASQCAKTEGVNNIIGARMRNYPGPMLLLQPTLDMAKAWSKDRLSPMLRDTPCLRGLVQAARTRDSGNTILHKLFPGGHLTIVGANSAAGLSMRPIRDLLADEVDRYPASAGTEGDPLRLAITRTRAFWDSKKAYIGSPTTKGASRMELIWARSDQRHYFVPCPECARMQTLKWSQVQWEKDDQGNHRPETARYVCEECGAKWNDIDRRRAVGRGEWRATKPFRGCAGFHINALAAPWESCNLEFLVHQWLEAQGDPELLKVFINTVLAEWWDEEKNARGVDDTGLMPRREVMEVRGDRVVIPSGAALVTAGVDIQANRMEVSVFAWGHREESWRLAHDVIYGDPSGAAVWMSLDEYLLRPWPRAEGGFDFIRGACVDTGHETQNAYDFCGARFQRVTPDGGRQFVFAVKGGDGPGEIWPRAASRVSSKVPLWNIRVDAAKEQIYGRLSIAEPGPGYLHFPRGDDRTDATYFKGLTAELARPRRNPKGFIEIEWFLPRGRRNEPLDCAVYAYAALHGLRANGFELEAAIAKLGHRKAWMPSGSFRGAPETLPVDPGATRRDPKEPSWLGDTRGWLR